MGLDGRAVGGAGAADRGLSAGGQGAASAPAADDRARSSGAHDNGAKWRSLPEALGPWWMAAQTFIRWSRLGVWERLLSLVQERGISLGMAFLDGTSIRAHQKAAGAAEKGRPRQERDAREALGRSRGGYGTKACVIADGKGRAIAFRLAPGQAHELPHAVPLLDSLPRVPKWVVGDRGYASHAFRAAYLGPGRAARDPAQAQRSAGGLPRLHLQQQEPRRAPLGPAQGVARRRHPLREDRLLLHGRALHGRRHGLAQELTEPNQQHMHQPCRWKY